jgi:4-hydroxybenzoate polyprenyltransferase
MKYLFFSLRPKHWVKNFFIFLPLIFAKKLFSCPANLKTAAAFLLFSLSSGVAYLINDIADIEKDKLHPTKKLRPLAAGKISLKQAKVYALILGILSVAASFMLNANFGWIVSGYLTLNILYSKILKNEVIIDVFCVSIFFLLRISAGSFIAEIEMSHWIILMTILLALFLALNKRRQELILLDKNAILHRQSLARYNVYFIDQMVAIITSSLVIFYALYTVDSRTVREFGTHHLIWTIPFVYYGIFRYLYLTHKLKKEGDPTRILFLDRKLQLDILFWISACIFIIYLGV